MQGQSEEIEYDTPRKWYSKEVDVDILISDKIYLKSKKVMRQNWTVYNDKGDHSSWRYNIYIYTHTHTHTHTYIYPHTHTHISNIESTKVYVKQLLTSLKGAIDRNTIVGDFNTQFTLTDSSSRQNSTMIQWS